MRNTGICNRTPPSVHLFGEIHGDDVRRVYDAIARSDTHPGERVVLDVSGVTSWTILAQAGVLHAARELASRRSRLVLVGASRDLCQQAQRLDVVNRVRRLGTPARPAGSIVLVPPTT